MATAMATHVDALMKLSQKNETDPKKKLKGCRQMVDNTEAQIKTMMGAKENGLTGWKHSSGTEYNIDEQIKVSEESIKQKELIQQLEELEQMM